MEIKRNIFFCYELTQNYDYVLTILFSLKLHSDTMFYPWWYDKGMIKSEIRQTDNIYFQNK